MTLPQTVNLLVAGLAVVAGVGESDDVSSNLEG
jgi:hypothetical protein